LVKRIRNQICIFILFIIICFAGYTEAGTFGFGEHIGYGVIGYSETSFSGGSEVESDTDLDAIIVGLSGEYSFSRPQNFFVGITTDWIWGSEDSEKWERDGTEVQTNDLRIFGQFYDLRLGYKNRIQKFYYRIYVSGGWDSIHFERDNFLTQETLIRDEVKESFRLWRTGGGVGFGYKFGRWALDGRAAYAYYPEGRVENSAGVKFDTEGTCIDLGAGVALEIIQNLNLYIGGSYTLIELDENEPYFIDSKIKIISGIINLTYAL
jgi:hypothetical protein